MVYTTEVRFNAIYVLESIRTGDLKSGRELYDSILLPAQDTLEGFFASYKAVRTADEFRTALAGIAEECARLGRGPLLHIEAHGDKDGIQLADQTYLPWADLREELSEINRASFMNLLVVASSCNGWFLTASMMPTERAPVFMVVGPPDEIPVGKLEDANKRFYRRMVETFDLNRALEAMNDGKPFADWVIKPATAEILFCRAFRTYVKNLGTSASLAERENRIVADVVRARQLDAVQSAALRLQVRKHITDHAWWYNHLRRPFLMLDLFPKNAYKFGLTYEKCFATAA